MKPIAVLLVLLPTLALCNLSVGRISFSAPATMEELESVRSGIVPQLQTALRANVSASVFNQSDSSYVVFSALSNTPLEAAGVQETINGWGVAPSLIRSALESTLAGLFATSTGRSATVSFTTECSFSNFGFPSSVGVGGTPAPPRSSCDSTLSLRFTAPAVPQNLQEALCSIMIGASSATCSEVVVTNPGSAVPGLFGIFEYTATVSDADIPRAIFALVDAFVPPTNSLVSNWAVGTIAATTRNRTAVTIFDGSSISTGDDIATEVKPGKSCAEELWYLVFLILIIPALFVSIRHAYSRGKRKGVIKAKEEQQEINDRIQLHQQKMLTSVAGGVGGAAGGMGGAYSQQQLYAMMAGGGAYNMQQYYGGQQQQQYGAGALQQVSRPPSEAGGLAY